MLLSYKKGAGPNLMKFYTNQVCIQITNQGCVTSCLVVHNNRSYPFKTRANLRYQIFLLFFFFKANIKESIREEIWWKHTLVMALTVANHWHHTPLLSAMRGIYHRLLAIYCLINMWRNLFNFSSKFLLNPIPVEKQLEIRHVSKLLNNRCKVPIEGRGRNAYKLKRSS